MEILLLVTWEIAFHMSILSMLLSEDITNSGKLVTHQTSHRLADHSLHAYICTFGFVKTHVQQPASPATLHVAAYESFCDVCTIDNI